MVKASFVQRLKYLSLQYRQSASFILPAHDHGGIISYRRTEEERDEAKDLKRRRLEKKEIRNKRVTESDRPSTTQEDRVKICKKQTKKKYCDYFVGYCNMSDDFSLKNDDVSPLVLLVPLCVDNRICRQSKLLLFPIDESSLGLNSWVT